MWFDHKLSEKCARIMVWWLLYIWPFTYTLYVFHLKWEIIVELDLWISFSKIQLFSDGVRQEQEVENEICTFPKFQCAFTSMFSCNQFETVENEMILIKMYFRFTQNPTQATKKLPVDVTIPAGPLFKNSQKLGGLEVLPTTSKMGYLFYYFKSDLGLIYKQSQIASKAWRVRRRHKKSVDLHKTVLRSPILLL